MILIINAIKHHVDYCYFLKIRPEILLGSGDIHIVYGSMLCECMDPEPATILDFKIIINDLRYPLNLKKTIKISFFYRKMFCGYYRLD